jgi:hypothetical protein
MYPLPKISQRAGQPGDAAVDLDQRTGTHRTAPGVDAQPRRGQGNEAVMLARPVIEIGESHAMTVGMDRVDGKHRNLGTYRGGIRCRASRDSYDRSRAGGEEGARDWGSVG